MAAEVQEQVIPLYHPAWRVPYQLDMMVQSYLARQYLVVGDLGTGKTHIGMGVAAYALMNGDAGTVLICCEKNKLLDWRDELAAHTSMGPVAVYHGPSRARLLAGNPQVVITTYETARQDLAKFASKRARKAADGPLMEWLAGRGKVVVLYDEASAKLGNRGSGVYKAQAHMLAQLRRNDPGMIVLALSGTPIERDWENAYNTFRLVVPGLMPPVKDFETYYTYGRDDYQRLRFRRDRMPEFAALCQKRMIRKRKTDPDVRDQFPAMTEEFERIAMHPDQEKLYKAVEDLAWDKNGDHIDVPGLQVILRQIAGHPRAILNSAIAGESRLAKMLADTIGDQLHACSAAKAEALLEYAGKVLAQDSKMLAFTFFGQSVLPALREILKDFPLFTVHGGMSASEQQDERARFRSTTGGAVLLSSDAGARGVNLPEASCVLEYESGLTYAMRSQRFGRAHRLGQGSGPLTCITFVLQDTIEVPLLKGALNRNEQHDVLTGDGDIQEGTTAADRRFLYSCARKRKL
jgi:SNF2 family DNA or RNA helicase